MKIGILGTGVVGRSHAERLAGLDYEIMIGTRDVAKTLAIEESDAMGNIPLNEWLSNLSKVKVGDFAETCQFGDVLINALKGENVLETFSHLEKSSLENKILIDISNALDFSKGMPPTLMVSDGNSLGEQLQSLLPQTKVVKTMNTVSAHLQVQPLLLADGDHHAFISGNDLEAKETVKAILRAYGWKNIIDLGDITTARGTELLMPLWLRLWGALGTPTFNYKIIK